MADSSTTEASKPSARDIQQGFDATATSPEGYLEFLKGYRSVKAAPFEMGDDIVRSLRALVLAHFEVFPVTKTSAAEAAMWSRSRDADHFAAMVTREQPNLVIAARDHLGTHTAKIPNPSVTGPGGLFSDADVFAAAGGTSFVSSATFQSRQRIGAAGNAAQGKAQRLLASRLVFRGEIIDVSRSIAEKGVVYDAMLELGFDPSLILELSEILDGRLAGRIGDDTPGQYAKGLIWPTDLGDMVITPVHCYAMHVEFAARRLARIAANARLDTTHVVVGGSKPQNAGLINSDMGGWHRMLRSVPPEVRSDVDRVLSRSTPTSKFRFGYIGKQDKASVEFSKAVEATWRNNDAGRKALDRRIDALARQAVSPLYDVYIECCDDAYFLVSAKERLPTAVRELVVAGFAGVEDDVALVNDVIAHIEASATLSLDDALRDRFRDVVSDVFADLFEGV
jgi:hypothetical protein